MAIVSLAAILRLHLLYPLRFSATCMSPTLAWLCYSRAMSTRPNLDTSDSDLVSCGDHVRRVGQNLLLWIDDTLSKRPLAMLARRNDRPSSLMTF